MDRQDWTLPPFQVEMVMAAASQTIDWGLRSLNVPDVWTVSRGKGTKCAVLDTGYSDHADLAGAIVDARDFTSSRSGEKDVVGHSTHCMGIIGARDNETGVVGIAPECSIYAGKVLGDNGSGSSRSVCDGIRWAIDKKVDVISMSLGSRYPDEHIRECIQEAVRAKIVIISAAGNSGPRENTTEYPGKWSECICVGACDVDFNVSFFSSRGPEVTVIAPGEKVLSTYLNNGVAILSGTSMACPFVAGVVLCMIAKHRQSVGATPLDTPEQIKEHLRSTSRDLGAPGPDPSFGWGLIDPKKVVLLYHRVPTPPVSLDFGPEDFSTDGLNKMKALFKGLEVVSVKVR